MLHLLIPLVVTAATLVLGNGLDQLACPPNSCKWITDDRYPSVGSIEGKVAGIDVFCHRGTDMSRPDFLANAWTRLRVVVESSTGSHEDFIIYRGANYSSVVAAKAKVDSEWLQWPWQESYVDVSPYGVTCWGLSFRSPRTHYMMQIKISRIYYRLPLCFFLGLFLFFSAPTLSQNVAFYYASSTSIGILAFLLVLIFVVSRFVPHRGAMYTVLVGGWAMSAYFFRYVAENAREIAAHYQFYIYIYIGVSALISAGYCYWKGPPTNHRSLKLIQVFIQLVAMGLIYSGTQSHVISCCVIAVVITMYWLDFLIPPPLRRWFKLKWLVWFPPQRKLLSEQQYLDQGRTETEKALLELREYLNSPGASPWHVVRKLNDPARFATFVESGDHVDEDETFLHERSVVFGMDGTREHSLPVRRDDDE